MFTYADWMVGIDVKRRGSLPKGPPNFNESAVTSVQQTADVRFCPGSFPASKPFMIFFRFMARKTLNEMWRTGGSLLFFQKFFVCDRPIKPFPFLTDEYL